MTRFLSIHRWRHLFFLALFLAPPACSNVKNKPAVYEKIEAGMTIGEVQAILGPSKQGAIPAAYSEVARNELMKDESGFGTKSDSMNGQSLAIDYRYYSY
jgi:hypothetical protein